MHIFYTAHAYAALVPHPLINFFVDMSLRPPTLQEICEHCEVPLEVLDQECSETGIVVLSNYCDDWEGTASRLGIPQRSIDDIDNDYKRARDKRSAFVREWKRMYGHKATYLSFLRALHDLQLVDNVEEAIKSLKEKNALKGTVEILYAG